MGAFLGLNLDIRHITFSAGNLGLALFGTKGDIHPSILIWSIVGIGIIGFVNFIVSFGLSLLLAFKSKNLPIKEIKPLMSSVFHEFKTNPISFLYPVKLKKSTEKARETIQKKKE